MQRVGLFSSKFYRTTFLLLFLAFFVSALAIVFVFANKTQDALYKREVASARAQIEMLLPHAKNKLLNRNGDSALFTKKTFPKIILTLIDDKSKVVETTSNYIDNSFTWDSPDLIEAKSSDFGHHKIFDKETDSEVFIISKAIYSDKALIGGLVFRVNVKDMKLSNGEYSNFLLPVVVTSLLFAILFAYLVTKSGYEPISQLLHVCRQISSGDYNRRVSILPNNEIGELGKSINALSSDVLNKITNLSLEKTQLKSILSVMSEGIISLNHNGDINFCNRNAYKIFGVQTSDVRGMNISVVDGFSLLAEISDEVLLTKKIVNKTLYISIKNENEGASKDPSTSVEKVIETHAVYYNTRDYKDADFPELHMRTRRGAILIFQDVTDVKRLEVIRRDFFANVSHELKTPLTSIKGYVETLLGGAIDDPKFSKRFVQKIESNAQRLTTLVYELLELAKIESSEQSALEENLMWTPIINSIVSRYETMITEKELTIVMDEEPTNHSVIGDQSCMAAVFENLLTNAIRYSHAGGTIEVKFDKTAESHILLVKDSGMGISKENLERIFERFYRADKARTREIGGTGLGLSIVKNLMSRMNGSVEVESTEGEGAVFSVFLPKAF